jgi:GT2 family glycosyltransferase
LIGPFDPALDVGTLTNGGGDLEMFFRVLKEGYTLVYEPGAIIRHRHRQTYEQLRRQLSYNGVALYAFFVCAALAYPDERRAFLRLGLWWFMWWFVRRLLLSFLNAYPLPRDLIWAELRQVFVGLTAYQRARRQAQSIEADFKVLPTLSYLTRRSASSQTGAAYATAVRTIDLSQPVSGLSGLESYASLRVFVTWKGQLLGNVDLTNHFKNISRQQLLAAIVDGLGLKLVYLDKSTNHNRTWREINDKLEAYLLADQPQKGGQTETHLAPDISVSVIVGTCDRPEDLANCLTNLQQQKTSQPVEIVVVDNNPTSGQTPPVTAAFPQVVLVNEPRKGVAYARNAGIEASTGDIIVTTDDDVTMPADWLENLLAPFSQPHVMAVTGNILPLELETDSQHLFELYGGLGRGYEPKEADPNWFQRFKLRAVPTWEYGGTANAAFRAGLFQNPDIGLMDESLGPGMPSGVGEDTYLFYRILQAGGTIRYEPTAYVWHKHRRTLKALRRQIYNYSKGHVAYHLTTLFRDKDLRALLQLMIWLPLGHLWRIYQRLRGKSSYTLLFLLIEIAGNLRGPGALIQSLWLVNRQGRSRSSRQPNRSAALKQPATQPQHFNPS